MVLNDLVDSFCYSLENAGLKGLKVSCGIDFLAQLAELFI